MVDDKRQAGRISAKGLHEWAKGQRAENRHGSADIAEIAADTIEALEERVGELEGLLTDIADEVEAAADLVQEECDRRDIAEGLSGQAKLIQQALREEPGEDGEEGS